MFLQTTDTSRVWHFVPNVAYHVHIMCLWVSFYIRRQRGGWWRHERSQQGVQVTPCHRFKGHLQIIPVLLVASITGVFKETLFVVTKTSSISISQHRTDILNPNWDDFITLTSWFMCLNLSRVWSQGCNRREIENSIQTNVKKRPVLKVRFVRKLSNSSDIDALGL